MESWGEVTGARILVGMRPAVGAKAGGRGLRAVVGMRLAVGTMRPAAGMKQDFASHNSTVLVAVKIAVAPILNASSDT